MKRSCNFFIFCHVKDKSSYHLTLVLCSEKSCFKYGTLVRRRLIVYKPFLRNHCAGTLHLLPKDTSKGFEMCCVCLWNNCTSTTMGERSLLKGGSSVFLPSFMEPQSHTRYKRWPPETRDLQETLLSLVYCQG